MKQPKVKRQTLAEMQKVIDNSLARENLMIGKVGGLQQSLEDTKKETAAARRDLENEKASHAVTAKNLERALGYIDRINEGAVQPVQVETRQVPVQLGPKLSMQSDMNSVSDLYASMQRYR